MLSGVAATGLRTRDHVHGGVTTQAAHAPQAQELIDLLTGAEQREQRERAGFLSRPK